MNIEKKQITRCNKCNKKIKLVEQFKCKCNQLLCTIHRYSDTHDCTFDWKSHDREILTKMNPVVVADKLLKI